MTLFFGRKAQLEKLRALTKKKSASLVVLKGRRRIGKSRLAIEFGKEVPSIILTGLPPSDETTAQLERDDFASQLERSLKIAVEKKEDWGDLFWQLAKVTEKKKILIVLDEINWMGSKDPTFLGKLKSAWDLYFKNNPRLILILSGSMSAWIERNILSSTGFMGRISLDLTLEELSLPVCSNFWNHKNNHISPFEIFKILSVTGGIPRYLEEIDPSRPAEENILDLGFKKGGVLVQEFDRIFSDLFSNKSATYKKIVSRLASGPCDLDQICVALGLQKSGTISQYIEDLVETGYISRDHTWSVKSAKEGKLCHYRLKDNYLRFYLKYIEPNKSKIERGTMNAPPPWSSIMGLQFENLVLNNRKTLYQKLAINTDNIEYDNPYFQRKTTLQKGCQIDLMIQTKFNTLYVCKIKFSKEKIGMQVIEEVQEKIKRIKTPKQFSFRPVLIHVNGVTEDVIESGYFASVIDFSEFLEI